MSKFGRIFWNNYDFIYVSIIFIDSLACDGYIEIRNTAEHFSYSSYILYIYIFFFLLDNIKHELSRYKA